MIWIDFLALLRNEACTSCVVKTNDIFQLKLRVGTSARFSVPTPWKASENDADEVNDDDERRRTRCAEECNAASVISQPGPVRDATTTTRRRCD